MIRRLAHFLLLFHVVVVPLGAAPATASASEISADEARGALDRACAAMRAIATHGGYLWRYSPDLRVRGGEVNATATQVWVQQPGTPTVGGAFLRTWRATDDSVHLDAARAAALALVEGQLQSGGWDYVIEFEPTLRSKWHYRTGPAPGEKARNMTTFDDNNTQGAIRFLVAFLEAAKAHPDPADARIAESLDYALRQVCLAQYPNGAWPQRWDGKPHDPALFPPLQATLPGEYPREQPSTGYYAHYTFNDGAHRDLVLALLDAARATGREDCRAAARRGAEFVLQAQLPEPQPAWAQQYDARMHPAWARAFEPPAVSSAETVGAIDMLLIAYGEFGDRRYLDAIPPALAWLERSAIAPGRWARLYELGTNRPIYGDRDGKVHYALEEISEERRRGYAWEGGFGVESVVRRHEKLLASGGTAAKGGASVAGLNAKQRAARLTKLRPAVAEAVRSLDADGRWLTDGSARRVDPDVTQWIETETFVRHTGLLCEYLELLRAASAP